MRNLLLLTFIALVCSFGLSQIADAVCVQNGTIPGQGNIISCPAPIQNTPLDTTSAPATTNLDDEVNIPVGGGINAIIGNAVNTANGDDIVTSSGNLTSGSQHAIFTTSGNDVITINDGVLIGDDSAISSGSEDDTVIINGGTIIGIDDRVIFTGGGNDTVTINGGIIDASDDDTDPYMLTSSGDDIVNLNGGTYLKGSDEVIDLGSDNDMLTFGADIDLAGFIDCNSGIDTLVFAMDVPSDSVAFISSQILSSDPADGSIAINGIQYSWILCENLVPDLNGVAPVTNVPTLSEWGLILLAAVMGIIGFAVYRRRLAV